MKVCLISSKDTVQSFFFQTPDKSNLFTLPQLAKELGFPCIQPPMSDHVKCEDLLVACEFFLLYAISKL